MFCILLRWKPEPIRIEVGQREAARRGSPAARRRVTLSEGCRLAHSEAGICLHFMRCRNGGLNPLLLPAPNTTMQQRFKGERFSSSQLTVLFLSCVASVYVMGRLWVTSRETYYLREELHQLQDSLAAVQGALQQGVTPAGDVHVPSVEHEEAAVLFYSIRTSTQLPVRLMGPTVDDLPPTQIGDGSLLGQVDSLAAGSVEGWACRRGDDTQALQVLVYVDGIKVAEATALNPVATPQILRMCQARSGQLGVGWSAQLPPLPLGKHELRAFVKSPDGGYKQELNQSPLLFKESAVEPDTEEQLRRKDAIIQIRNAQIAALWDELHTRQPWRNAIEKGPPLQAFGEDAERGKNGTRLLVFLGINTGLGAKARRDILRRTWVPSGAALQALERERGVRIRFVVGQSEQRDDPMELQIKEEMRQYNDILRLDMVDTYNDLSLKTLKLFGEVPNSIDADFYFKIDDDVGVNVGALADYLEERRTQGNLYLGCMKSGQVLTDKRWKWYEPEHWRFGDPAGNEGRINYPRHASGQFYGVSRAVARYIGQNTAVLHRFANEDVTFGTWLLGLEIQYADERRLCCDSEAKCDTQTGKGNVCLGYYEHQCAGTCYAEQRLEPIWHHCLEDPFNRQHREAHPHPDAAARAAEAEKAAAERAAAAARQVQAAQQRQQAEAEAAQGGQQQQAAAQQ